LAASANLPESSGEQLTQVRAYVDGFNLYHGLRQDGRRHLWLDLEALATSLLKPGQHLDRVRYFTARVRNDPPGEQRQADYLDALLAHSSGLEVIEGRFQQKTRSCGRCRREWVTYEEKETDVSIAVALVEDGVLDHFDTALVISADSDLCPAIRSLKRLRPAKKVIAAFPPNRRSDDLRRAADAAFTIGAAKIRQSQLPPSVPSPAGIMLVRPSYWH
jgi:uncharacterized LabA/DUF88 family protein